MIVAEAIGRALVRGLDGEMQRHWRGQSKIDRIWTHKPFSVCRILNGVLAGTLDASWFFRERKPKRR